MKNKHKKHLAIMKQLVNDTDWYVSMAWDDCNSIVKGLLVKGMIEDNQRFSVVSGCGYIRGTRMKWSLMTPPFIQGGNIFFALMNRDSNKRGVVVNGWKALKDFIADERVMKKLKEYQNGK